MPPERYVEGTYASLDRFISYSYQLRVIRASGARSILFIGVGDGLVADLLKKDHALVVTTLDIDPELKPDCVGDIRALPFPDASFDAVCAFEVLEHLPWEETQKGITEMARVSKTFALISVPHRRTGFAVAFKLPFMRRLLGRSVGSFALLLPVRFPGFAVSGQHYWEIDGWATSLRTFRRALAAQFDIDADFTPPLDYYHHFFLLRCRRPSAVEPLGA